MQQFRTEPSTVVTEAEAQEVLRLHLGASEQAGAFSSESIAEALGISLAEVDGLLARARAQQKQEAHHKAEVPVMKASKRRDLFLVVLAVALFMSIALNLFVLSTDSRPPSSFNWATRVDSIYELQVGTLVRNIPARVPPLHAAESTNLLEVLGAEAQEMIRNADPSVQPQFARLRVGQASINFTLPKSANAASSKEAVLGPMAEALKQVQTRAELSAGVPGP